MKASLILPNLTAYEDYKLYAAFYERIVVYIRQIKAIGFRYAKFFLFSQRYAECLCFGRQAHFIRTYLIGQ
jgi:hypothetical protein